MNKTAQWEKKKLGQLLEIKSGKDYKNNKPGAVDSFVPVYGTGGIINYVDKPLYTGDAVGIGRKGTIDKPQRLSGAFWTVDTLFYCLPKEGFNVDFLFQLCKSIPWRKHNEASGVPSLSAKTIKNILVSIPPLAEQEKIAEFLSALDDMITLQESKIELLDKQKKGYVQRIFSRELRFRDDNGNEYPGWENKRLDSFTNFRMGFTPDTKNDKFWKGDNDWLSIAGMNSKYISKGNKKISDSSLGNKKPFPADTLIMSFKLTLGRCAILRENVFTNEAICGFENNETFNNEYLYYALSNTDVASFGSQAVKGLTLNSENIGSIIVPFPSLLEQEKIASFLSTLDGQITLEKEKLTQLKLQKQGYMQRIFG